MAGTAVQFTGIQPIDGNQVPTSSGYSPQNNTFYALQDADGAYTDQFGNQSTAPVMSFIQPRVSQRGVAQTGAAAKSLSFTFNLPNVGGNSIVVCLGVGDMEDSVTSFAVTDTQGNTYTKVASQNQGSTLESAIYLATGIKLGQNTITVNITGPTAIPVGISMKIYEAWGLIASVDSVDKFAVGNNAGSNQASTGILAPVAPNTMAFTALAVGKITTITPVQGWSNNDGTIFPWGGNLGAFDSQYRLLSTMNPVTPQANISLASPWAMCSATFRTIMLPIEGTVYQGGGPWSQNLTQVNGANIALGPNKQVNSLPVVLPTDQSPLPAAQSGAWSTSPAAAPSGGSTPFHLVSAATTNAIIVKPSPGQIYNYCLSSNVASDRWVKFYDKAVTLVVGTDIPTHTVKVPANGIVIRAMPEGCTFKKGIGVATTANVADSDTTAVGANDLVVDFNYF